MVIRPAQIEVFERAAGQRFEEAAWKHLQEFVPRHCAAAGKEVATTAIRAAMKKAQQYGLAQERPVLQFIDLSFILGAGFDEDPQFPWIRPALSGSDETAMARMDELYEKALLYSDSIAGPQGELVEAALKRLSQKPIEQAIDARIPFPRGAYTWFEQIFPEKVSFFAQRRTEELISAWQKDAAACGLSAPVATLVYVTLSFFLGTGFRNDPLAPWAHAISGEPAPDGGEARARHVYEAGRKVMGAWFSDVHPGM